MQQHPREITPEDLSTIQSDGFSAVVDAYARDFTEETIWFLSMLGNQTALKAIAAQLLSLPPKAVHIVDEKSNDPSQDEYLSCKIPDRTIGTWTHKITRLPNTKAFHSLLYTKKAEYAHDSLDFVLLSRTQEEAPALHYMFLDRRTNVPLHESWAQWLWDHGIDNDFIIPLQSKGIFAYICTPDPGIIIEDLSQAISERRLILPEDFNKNPRPEVQNPYKQACQEPAPTNTNALIPVLST